MKIILSIFLFIFVSCKTYDRSTCIKSWKDNWNYKYTIFETKRYLRKNDSLIMIKTDTVITDLDPKNEASEYSKNWR